MKNTKNLSNFPMICTYLNLVKNSKDNFIANKKFEGVTTLKF